MQLRHLETFLAIVEQGTLTAAATALFKSQAAVSQDLKALEAGLGLALLDRTGQRVALTSAGEALIPLARRLLGEVADVEAEMARIRAGEQPVVRIACLPSVASRVCNLVSDFRRSHPAVRWSVISALRGAVLDGVRQSRFDLGICEGRPEEDIELVPLERELLKIVVRDGHPLASLREIRPSDLDGLTYIGMARGMGATIEAQRFFAAGNGYPMPDIEVNDTRMVCELVFRTDGFGILPESGITGQAQLAVIATDPPITRQISLVRMSGRAVPPAAKEFAEHIAANWVFHDGDVDSVDPQ